MMHAEKRGQDLMARTHAVMTIPGIGSSVIVSDMLGSAVRMRKPVQMNGEREQEKRQTATRCQKQFSPGCHGSAVSSKTRRCKANFGGGRRWKRLVSVHFSVAPSSEPAQSCSMGSAVIVLLVIVGIVVLLALYAIGVYNGLVALRNRFKNAFAQIDVQLKRRYDLIPNLVETAKAYLKHESQTLEAVIAARNAAQSAGAQAAANPGDPTAMRALAGAEGGLTASLGRLFAVAEAYPDLKANQNMMQLSEELTSTENKVSFARQAYNDAVMAYNTQRESFPANIVAGMFNFGGAELFQIDNPTEKEAPKVSFS